MIAEPYPFTIEDKGKDDLEVYSEEVLVEREDITLADIPYTISYILGFLIVMYTMVFSVCYLFDKTLHLNTLRLLRVDAQDINLVRFLLYFGILATLSVLCLSLVVVDTIVELMT